MSSRMAAPRVIFLDIDGVICCNMAGRLEESKLAVLNTVVKASDAKPRSGVKRIVVG